MKHTLSIVSVVGITLSLSLLSVRPAEVSGADPVRVFATPEEAVAALGRAVSTTNRAELGVLFGPAAEQLVNPDEVQGEQEMARFTKAFKATHQLVPESDGRLTLEVGTNNWPFPIPVTKRAEGWLFDTQAGLEELLNRRIGRNELDVLEVMRAYVDAQREYASKDRDGDGVLEFAQMIASSPGRTDGLYWAPELNGEISPLGPLVAHAQSEGYSRRVSSPNTGPQPFHGYFFKTLTRQGTDAVGGKYNYIINGNMIGGFALLAWPAEYAQSGVMSFIVNQQGRVYEKDLGSATARLARKMSVYNPDESWRPSID